MKRAYPVLLVALSLFAPSRPAAAQSTEQPSAVTEASTGAEPMSSCPAPLLLRQSSLVDVHADFARAAQVAGAAPLSPLLIRRASQERRATICADAFTAGWGRDPSVLALPAGLEFEVLPLAWSSHYNTAYPQDRNNGVLWAGRGLATEFRGGFALRWGPLSAAVAPVLHHQRNRAFELATGSASQTYSPYVYQGRAGFIDWPQRFGDRPFGGVDPGDSYIRLDAGPLAIGLSHENLWWGPARHNPLLMSNTAGGFPHLFLGSSGPVDLWIGRLEGELVWGQLRESDYFDQITTNNRRLLASIVFNFEPRWVPGLYLGAARSYLRDYPDEGLPLSVWLLGPYRDVRHNPLGRGNPEADNQLFSVFARWAPPRAGFEAYVEFARDDHWADMKDLIAEPDVSSAFTLGFQQVIPRGERWLRLSGEVTRISDPYPTISRPFVTFYSHGQLRQGYTHRGQILGAAIGPNANALHLGVDLFTPNGRRGLFLERVRYSVDANGERWVREYGVEGADIEWSIGVDHRLFLHEFDLGFLRHLDLGWALTHSYRRNRHYFGLTGAEPQFRAERNWTLRLDLAWRPWARTPLAALRGTPTPP